MVKKAVSKDYLAAIDQWKKKKKKSREEQEHQNNVTTSTTVCTTITDNLECLLKDVVESNDVKFLSMFAKQQQQQQHVLLETIAKGKVLMELDNLYEEYSFAIAKDASLTDNLRREQDKWNKKKMKKKQPSNPENNENKAKDDEQEEEEEETIIIQQHTEDSLVYGEVDLEGFCNLLWSLPPHLLQASSSFDKKHKFYDIGSGSGRAVFAARFIGDFDVCVGIELLENLHQLAVSVHSLYKFVYSQKISKKYSGKDGIQFVHSDLLDYDWSDGTVVYAPSLLFDAVMMKKIAIKALALREGAYLISLKRFFQDNDKGGGDKDDGDVDAVRFQEAFEIVQQAVFPMSWGDASVYVYRRTATAE